MLLDFIAGLFGGAAGVLVGHPLDTVKVHLQTDDPRNPKYKGTFHCMRVILLNDNVRGLYRGISSPMMGIGLVNAIVFGVYGNIQRISDNPNSLMTHFFAGATAGVAQGVICAPMELAKTRLQLSTQIDSGQRFKGPIDCLKYIQKTEGLRGTFKGLSATILRDVPGFSSYFVSYEFMMSLKETPSSLYTLMSGGFAGICSWLACYPIDVVKTQLQADALGKAALYNGFVDCAIKNYEKEGIHFFFRGLNSTLLRAFPMNAACFFVVEYVLDFCKRHNIELIGNSNRSLKVVKLENTTEHDLQTDGELVRKIISDNSSDFLFTNDVIIGSFNDKQHWEKNQESKMRGS